MKLLTEVTDLSELNRLRLLFEMSGVLIYVGNEDSARNFGFLHPVGKYAIHVVYDEQYQDALMLLQDENHIVENPIDVEAYKAHIEKNTSASVSQLMRKILLSGILFVMFAFAIVWLLVELTK